MKITEKVTTIYYVHFTTDHMKNTEGYWLEKEVRGRKKANFSSNNKAVSKQEVYFCFR
jgi:hypothetical protein